MSDELDGFFADVVAGVDSDIARDGAGPDLAAVIARAHELDPTRVPAEAVQEVASWAPVVSLAQGRRMRDTRDDPEFQAIVNEVRAHVDQDVAVGLGGGAQRPKTEAPAANESPAIGYRVWVTVFAAAAALVLVTVGIMQAPQFVQVVSEPITAEAAFDERLTPPWTLDSAKVRDGKVEAVVPDPEPEPEPELEAELKPHAKARKRRPKASTQAIVEPPTPTKEDRIAELDRLAHAAWKAGKRKKAESLFREIISLAGSGRYADLAYGDLFTLASQSKQAAKKAKLWQEYLKRFPRGRFADDARSGLCRRVESDARVACWEDYLRDMPKGAFRGTALREVERARAGK